MSSTSVKRRRSLAARKAWETRKQPGWEPERVRFARLEQLEKMVKYRTAEAVQLSKYVTRLFYLRPGMVPL